MKYFIVKDGSELYNSCNSFLAEERQMWRDYIGFIVSLKNRKGVRIIPEFTHVCRLEDSGMNRNPFFVGFQFKNKADIKGIRHLWRSMGDKFPDCFTPNRTGAQGLKLYTALTSRPNHSFIDVFKLFGVHVKFDGKVHIPVLFCTVDKRIVCGFHDDYVSMLDLSSLEEISLGICEELYKNKIPQNAE